jgi:hypothetical protein
VVDGLLGRVAFQGAIAVAYLGMVNSAGVAVHLWRGARTSGTGGEMEIEIRRE